MVELGQDYDRFLTTKNEVVDLESLPYLCGFF